MFVFTCSVLENVIDEALLILCIRIIDVFCQYLQQKSQDIVNVMHLVLSSKSLIQKLRVNG